MRIHHLDRASLCPFGRRLVNGEGGLLPAPALRASAEDPTAKETPAMFVFERLVALDYARVQQNHARLRALRADHHHEVSIFCAHDPTELHAG